MLIRYPPHSNERIKHSFPCFNFCQARVWLSVATRTTKRWGLQHIITRGLGQMLKHRKRMLYCHCYIPSQSPTCLKNPCSLETTFCFADVFWAGVGFNGINALASHVLTASQPSDTLLTQCDILKIDVCPGNGQQVLSVTTPQFYTVNTW